MNKLLDRADEFLLEFRALVHKYAGNDYAKADLLLLTLLQERTSVFNPFIWPETKA